MKNNLIILSIILCYSCKTLRHSTKNYYYIESFKKQEIKLIFRNDSTFRFIDETGYNQFEFTGKYRRKGEATFEYFIFGSVYRDNEFQKNNVGDIFPIKALDTAWILNSDRLIIDRTPFKLLTKENLDLQKKGFRMLEEYYINLWGKKKSMLKY